MTHRHTPTRREAVEIVLRQDGRCTVCGGKLQPKNIHFDHIHALALEGGNEIDNFRAICSDPCHKAKTRADVKANAKSKRIRGKKSARFSPLPTGSEIGAETEPDNARVRRKRDWPKGRKLQSRNTFQERRP